MSALAEMGLRASPREVPEFALKPTLRSSPHAKDRTDLAVATTAEAPRKSGPTTGDRRQSAVFSLVASKPLAELDLSAAAFGCSEQILG